MLGVLKTGYRCGRDALEKSCEADPLDDVAAEPRMWMRSSRRSRRRQVEGMGTVMGVAAVSVAALLWVWAIGDAMAIDDEHLQSGEKAAWVAAVMLLPVGGALAWLAVGRRATQRSPSADRHADIDGGPSVSWVRLRRGGQRS